MKKAFVQPLTYGFIAQFPDAEQLVDAVRAARREGYERMDAYTPYAIDGLADELRNRDDRVPWIVFICGVTGASLGFLLQYYVTCVDFPMNIGGRPNFSWPSYIPITFECGVLLASFGALIGMLMLNGLPRPHHPLFNVPAFDEVTNDKFFLCIEAEDAKFSKQDTRQFLQNLGSELVEEVPE